MREIPRARILTVSSRRAKRARDVTDKTQIVLLHLGAYYRIKGDTLAQHAPDGTLVSTAQSLPWYQKSVEALSAAVPLDHEFNDDKPP